MAARSADWCISHCDYEEAMARYEKANKQWKPHWLECLKSIYEYWCKDLPSAIANKIKSIIDEAASIVHTVTAIVTKKEIEWNCENKNWEKGTELFYLVRMIDSNGRRVFSKIGTTKRTIQRRMSEHFSAYKNYNIQKIIIDKIIECPEDAVGMESIFRAYYMRKYKEHYVKNDRFFDMDFDLNEAETIYQDYLSIGA